MTRALILLVACSLATRAYADDVLVWHDATFYLAPNEKAESFRIATLAGTPREQKPSAVVAMHVIKNRGEWIELEPATGVDCSWSSLQASNVVGIHLFVHATDLAPAITKRYAKTFDDGTAITLEVGTPAIVSGEKRAIPLGADAVTLALPGASIGTTYAPHQPKGDSLPDGDQTFVKAHAAVTVGDASITVAASFDPWRASAVVDRTAAKLVTVQHGCVHLTVAAQPADVVTVSQHDRGKETRSRGGAGMSRDGSKDLYLIPQGATLYTKAGNTRLGTAETAIEVDDPADAKQACTQVRIELEQALVSTPHTKSTDTKLEACIPVARLKHVSGKSPR